jgi:hypothetical protein
VPADRQAALIKQSVLKLNFTGHMPVSVLIHALLCQIIRVIQAVVKMSWLAKLSMLVQLSELVKYPDKPV